jgi:ribosome-binding factor A
MNRRNERVNVLLRQEISRLLATELKDPRLPSILSITRVETSPDLRVARVFVSVLGDKSEKADTLKALRSASGYVRRKLRQQVTLKMVPSVEFRIDESIERGAEMMKLISEAAPSPESSGKP